MNYNKYMRKYNEYLNKWNAIKARNESGDYSCGCAIYGPSCDKVIAFDDAAQKENYRNEYGF